LNPAAPLLASQQIVQVCLFIVAAIAMVGGALQMVLGQPDTLPRLDNVHRFMAGVGRLVSMRRVGLPRPAAVWLGYLIPELLLPVVIVVAWRLATA